jgi:hypothetical protein
MVTFVRPRCSSQCTTAKVKQWRYLLYFAFLAVELSLLLSSSPVTTAGVVRMLGLLFPKRVVFQHVLFCHQVFVFLSIALSRIAPVLWGDGAIAGAGRCEAGFKDCIG